MWSSKRFAVAAAAVVVVAGALGWVFSVWFPAEAPVVHVTGDPVITSEYELVDQEPDPLVVVGAMRHSAPAQPCDRSQGKVF
jgi:hypothetical protein